MLKKMVRGDENPADTNSKQTSETKSKGFIRQSQAPATFKEDVKNEAEPYHQKYLCLAEENSKQEQDLLEIAIKYNQILDVLREFGGDIEFLKWVIAEIVSLEDSPEDVYQKIKFVEQNATSEPKSQPSFTEITEFADAFENKWFSKYVNDSILS